MCRCPYRYPHSHISISFCIYLLLLHLCLRPMFGLCRFLCLCECTCNSVCLSVCLCFRLPTCQSLSVCIACVNALHTFSQPWQRSVLQKGCQSGSKSDDSISYHCL